MPKAIDATTIFASGRRRKPVDPIGLQCRNFSGVEPKLARTNLGRMNSAIADIATRYGQFVDLHAHFLQGDPSWFTATIEPSLRGASEVRRAFLPQVMQWAQR